MMSLPSAVFLAVNVLSLMARGNTWWMVFLPAAFWVIAGQRGASFFVGWAFLGCFSDVFGLSAELHYAVAAIPALFVARVGLFEERLNLNSFWGFPLLVVLTGAIATLQFLLPTDLLLFSLGFWSLASGARSALYRVAFLFFGILFAASAVYSARTPSGLLRFYEKMAPDPWSFKQFYKDGPFAVRGFEFYKNVDGHHYLGSESSFMDDDSKRFAAFGMAPVRLMREFLDLQGEAGPISVYGPLTKSLCEKASPWRLDLVKTARLPELAPCPRAREDDDQQLSFVVALAPFDVATLERHMKPGGTSKRNAALLCVPRYRARDDKLQDRPSTTYREPDVPGMTRETIEFRTTTCFLYTRGEFKKLNDLRASPVMDRFLTVKGDL